MKILISLALIFVIKIFRLVKSYGRLCYHFTTSHCVEVVVYSISIRVRSHPRDTT